MPNQDLIEIRTTPPDLFNRMERYPQELDREMEKTTNQAILHVWGSIPPYPTQRLGSRYERTGTLGRTLGTSMGGGMTGKPEIYTVRKMGGARWQGKLGTRLYYAPRVIGTFTQRPLFKRLGWWTMRTVKEKAEPGVKKLFGAMTERLVKFLGK